jgi:DNA polymerase beta
MAQVDYKSTIINDLNVILEKEKQNKNVFKIRAYQKVIPQLVALPQIKTLEDIKNVEGVGKGIKDRIKEILETGELHSAEEIKKDPKTVVIKQFMNIYGIGPVKAKNLYETNNITSISELKEKAGKLLNDKQKIGLKYYEDLQERIPRKEMLYHEKKIIKIVATISENKFVATIVGSFRREKPDSGDIDVLLSYEDPNLSIKEAEDIFQKIINQLLKDNYITDILALGTKKCMAICRKENEKARRLDLLLTPPEEYPFAILYFTGSDKFNIQMRKNALKMGYSLSEHGIIPAKEHGIIPASEHGIIPAKEHGLKPLQPSEHGIIPASEHGIIPDNLKTEKDIFKFLNMKYLEPKDR